MKTWSHYFNNTLESVCNNWRWPSSRAWRCHSVGSLLHSTPILAPGFGLSSDGPSLAKHLSSVEALCHLQWDINLHLSEVEAASLLVFWFMIITVIPPKNDITHCFAKTPLLLPLFSTWILRRCTPPPAETLGRTASWCLCHPVSERAPQTTRTAAPWAGAETSCCQFLANSHPDQPFYFDSPVMSHTLQSFPQVIHVEMACNHCTLLRAEVDIAIGTCVGI